jgi:membrane fusion protein (multidrug efflux system)
MDQDPQAERPTPVQPTARNAGHRDSAPPTRGKRIRAVVISLVLIVAALIVVWRWYEGTRRYVSTDDAVIDADRMNISSKMLGRIAALGADEGDTVSAGQMMVQLDISDLRAQSAQGKANLVLAEQNARLARISLDRAKSDADRAQLQYQNQTMTAEQFEHAQNDYHAAQSRLAIAEAQIAASRAQIATIDTSLANATVFSPMRGVVSKRWALPGDVVQPAQPIFSVYRLDSVWVTANLEETKLARLHLGDAVTIHVDAYRGREFSGRVVRIGANTAAQFSLIPPNNASGNFTKITQRVPVKISILNDPTVSLLPGMSVVVKVKI